ncbi:MAG TPA: hypothetical protein VF106_35995, partial [Actinophytocola sp.]
SRYPSKRWGPRRHSSPTSVGFPVYSLTGLDVLRLAGNRLAALPPAVCRLSGLSALNLSRNRLTAVPETIGALTHLVHLDLSDNMLTALPEALDGLATLTRLEVAGNPMSPRVPPPPAFAPVTLGRSSQFGAVVRGLTTSDLGGKDAMDSMFGDIASLPELTGDERTEAEDLAIAIVRAGDPRAALALGDADCARAVPALLDMATSTANTAYVRLLAARGLLKLGHGTGRATVIAILRDSTAYQHDRCDAIRVLAAHPDGETEAVLEQAAADADPEVRSCAASALSRSSDQ